MTGRGGDQGFAVVTQSVTGGDGRGPRRARRIGVIVVVLAAVAVVAAAVAGPRLSDRPSFDTAFFATPTPGETASPSPTATPTFPNQTPEVTPLPLVTRPDGSTISGTLTIVTDSIQSLDLATGRTTQLQPAQLWQDAILGLGNGTTACLCIVDGFVEAGSTRTLRYVRLTGDAAVSSDLATWVSGSIVGDQPDPQLDMALDGGHRRGLIASATRTKTGWAIAVRPMDLQSASAGPETPVGAVPLPPAPPGPSPTPVPSDQPQGEQLYLDGPHLRLSPDGRVAFVSALAQHYTENTEPTVSRGAWWIRLAADGSIEDVMATDALTVSPRDFCFGSTFTEADELVALCGAVPDGSTQANIPWEVRIVGADGRLARRIEVPASGDYGYGEPLVDAANRRLYLWDLTRLQIVRIDVDSGAVATNTFDPAVSAAGGVTSGAAGAAPHWHDSDSSVQQNVFETLAGAPDGSRLYGIGIRLADGVDSYSTESLGVFVIDPATLALTARWAPVSSDIWIGTLDGDRVVVGAQPGFDVHGHQVPWEGSLTIRDAHDGRILARYGRVSTGMAPVVIGP